MLTSQAIARVVFGALLVSPSLTAQSTPWSQGAPLPSRTDNVDHVYHADLNGDGLQDVVQTAEEPGRILVSLALGPRSFEVPHVEARFPDITASESGLSRHVAAIADLNQDGHLDLFSAVAGYCCAPLDQTQLHVLLGRGDGTFETPIELPLIPTPIYEVAAVDLNGDAVLDLVVGGNQQSLLVMLGLGAGQFAAPASLVEGGTGSQAFEFEDFDADGFIDLLAHTWDPAGSGALAGANVFCGDGTLPFLRSSAVPLGGNPRYVDAADLDLDGDLDIVLWVENSRRPSIVESLGARTFAAPVNGEIAPLFTRGYLVDVDGDGLEDLVDGKRFGAISVARNLGQLRFSPRVEAAALGGQALTFFDEDGDGVQDCVGNNVVSSSSFAQVLTLMGGSFAGGSYALQSAARIEEEIYAQRAHRLDAAPGEAPRLLVSGGPGGRLLSYGRESSDPERWGQPQVVLDRTEAIQWTVLSDFTGDGRGDLLVFGPFGTTIDLMVGDGQGGFTAPVPALTHTGGSYDPSAVDLDNDGATDVLWMDSGQRNAFVAFATPGAGLGSVQTIAGSTNLGPVAALDVDGDGDRDLVFAQDGRIEVALHLPGQTFGSRSIALTGVPLPGFFVTAAAEDVDVDGDDDFVYGDSFGVLQVVASDGAGGLAAPVPLLPPGPVVDRRFEFGDFDLDGDRDLVATLRLSKSSRRHVGLSRRLGGAGGGPPLFSVFEASGVDTDENATFLLGAEDLDLDGDLDLVTTSTTPYVSMNGSIAEIGTGYCAPLVNNSTGQPGLLHAVGSTDLALNRMSLMASQLPPTAFGFFLGSLSAGLATQVPGSVGTLCLGGSIGRFVGPGEIKVVDALGRFELEVDLARIPTPNMGRVPVLAGETWHFQAWHREAVGGIATSNFTDAVRVDF